MIKTRRWKPADIPAIAKLQRAAYPRLDEESLLGERKPHMQLGAYPEGQFLAERDGEAIAYATSLIVQLDDDPPWYSYDEITGVGTFSTHDLHITSVERHWYDIQPGDKLRVFDTPLGRIGIVVCYDVEFPEFVRLLADSGIEILFVPFATDERKSYFRVRHCAQARAVENVIYVVLAGCVGNLPQVKSFLINDGQAAICTPCDVAFPKDGVLAEAEPNCETVVVAELDLNSLAMHRDLGSVRTMQDRRLDLYELRSRTPVEVVHVR